MATAADGAATSKAPQCYLLPAAVLAQGGLRVVCGWTAAASIGAAPTLASTKHCTPAICSQDTGLSLMITRCGLWQPTDHELDNLCFLYVELEGEVAGWWAMYWVQQPGTVQAGRNFLRYNFVGGRNSQCQQGVQSCRHDCVSVMSVPLLLSR